MNNESKQFLHDLLNTPSPTGFEERIQAIVRKRMEPFADSIKTDLHGNVMVGVNVSAKRRLMLAGHCDQIGFLVKHISKEGFIYFAPLGGIDAGVCPGSHVTIYAEKGEVLGVFGRKPIHAQSADERAKMTVDLDKFFVDIGAKNQKEAEKRVSVGDFATFTLGVTELSPDLFCGPGLDDKTGLFVAMEALRLCAESKLSVALYAVSTVQEEVGLRGARTAAYAIDPEIGIGIDVTHSNDTPHAENNKTMPCRLGDGPCIVRGPNINPVVARLLFAAAKKLKLKHQVAIESRLLGNDTNSIQVSKGGVAAGCVSIPNRYMHTQVETCSYQDLENSAKLLAEFIKSIKPTTDFTPGK